MAEGLNPVGWFEIAVSDLDRATTFYEKILDMKLDRHTMGPLDMAWFPMTEGYGATGSLVKGEMFVPSKEGTLIYFSVPSIETVLERIAETKTQIIMPKTNIGDYGFIAKFIDSEGNHIGLHCKE